MDMMMSAVAAAILLAIVAIILPIVIDYHETAEMTLKKETLKGLTAADFPAHNTVQAAARDNILFYWNIIKEDDSDDIDDLSVTVNLPATPSKADKLRYGTLVPKDEYYTYDDVTFVASSGETKEIKGDGFIAIFTCDGKKWNLDLNGTPEEFKALLTPTATVPSEES